MADSRKQMHALFGARQIMFSPRCNEQPPGFPALIEGFRRTKGHTDGSFVKKGHWTHGPDSVRYLAWRFLPRPQPPRIEGIDTATADEVRSINIFRR